MGNKPAAPITPGSFTAKLAKHSQVAYYPYPVAQPDGVLVPFVLNELLIGPAVYGNPKLVAALKKSAKKVGEVFDPKDGKAITQVEIWQLAKTPGKKKNADVAEFVWDFRANELKNQHVNYAQVAPNHVLIPARDFDQCPFGPPEQPAADGQAPNMNPDPNLVVVVIDSGWVQKGPAAGLVKGHVMADWFKSTGNNHGWVASPPSPLLTPAGAGRHRLAALAGHANFVAGTLAARCPGASIQVVSHNSAFVEKGASGPAIATEASVARALWRHRNADLINLGFAFPTLPNVPLTKENLTAGSPPSWAFQAVLDAIDAEHEKGTKNRYPYILAPAGNQGAAIPQYPAAFGETRDNVIGVGSTTTAANGASDFSNHGSWVKCASGGENVESTFLTFTGETEEMEPGVVAGVHPQKTFTGWAVWNGTCFSTPKVTAALACRKLSGMTMPNAWADLINGTAPGFDVGFVLTGKTP